LGPPPVSESDLTTPTFWTVSGGDDGPAFEHAAQTLDVGCGPVREVAQGAFADLAAPAVALAQEDGRGRVRIRDGFDIHGGKRADAALKIQSYGRDYMATFQETLGSFCQDFCRLDSIAKREARLRRPVPFETEAGACGVYT
jgi:hypothetical protein